MNNNMINQFFLYDLKYTSFSSFKTEYIYGKQYRRAGTDIPFAINKFFFVQFQSTVAEMIFLDSFQTWPFCVIKMKTDFLRRENARYPKRTGCG